MSKRKYEMSRTIKICNFQKCEYVNIRIPRIKKYNPGVGGAFQQKQVDT